MAKRGQTYPYRVRYEWTTGAAGVIVASNLEEAQAKADYIEAAGHRHPDHDVTITIVRFADLAVLETRTTAIR